MFWYCDFEAYQIGNADFIIKEICILSNDGCECYNYFITNPKKFPFFPDNNTSLSHQYRRHKLRWTFGDYSFQEAMDDIRRKVRDWPVLVKGNQKVQFLQQHLYHVKEIEGLPALKYLNNCPQDWCDYKHGVNCARRKVHEIRIHNDMINRNIENFW